MRLFRMTKPFGALVCALFAAHAASNVSAADGSEIVAITNARIVTMNGARQVIPAGSVLMRAGVITAVGADVPIPTDARVVDAGGKMVTPGLVATNTTLSLTEVDGVVTTIDYVTSNERLSAAFDVQYGINPESTLIPIARLGGITRAIVTPQAGGSRGAAGAILAGQAAIVHLGAGSDSLVQARAGVVVDLSEAAAMRAGGGRGSSFVLLTSVLEDVRHYARHRVDFDRNASRPYPLSRDDLEALVPIVERRAPLVVTAHRASDILQVLKIAREQRVRLILEGAEEGWLVAEEIARADVPVILKPDANLPKRFEALAADSKNAARLHAAGVLLAIETLQPVFMARTPRFAAGRAVANGLPFDAALAAITINPARIWNMERRFGSIEPGKDGDLVIWSGDPLELRSAPVAVFIKGREQSLRSRELELLERYSKPSGDYPPAYR